MELEEDGLRMKVIIAGSRNIPPEVCDELVAMGTRIAAMRGWEITEVVWGKARGVDAAGQRWAEQNGIPYKPFAADWKEQPKVAGFMRNAEMARYADALIAITIGTGGTRNMIQNARTRKLPMIVLAISGGNAWAVKEAG
jgi:hypothetical protein